MNQIANSTLIRSACALALGLVAVSTAEFAQAQISVSITLAPPALPVYEQPVLVEEGAIWEPGYWQYNQGAYIWVPGSWAQPPAAGQLWTPGYWGWGNGGYAWNAGYWGATIGFYGGINYGFGYFGHGYEGGHWQGEHFYYNTAVSHVNVTNIHNTYTKTVVNNTTVNRVSFNGGKGGISARPTSAERMTASPHHAETASPVQHREAAKSDPSPPEEKRAPVHAADMPAITHQAVARTGAADRDKENQRQQDELRDSHEKQRQELQQKQADDHARAAKQPSASNNGEELERQHQAQTQALAQRHTSEQKSLRDAQESRPEQKRGTPPSN